MKLSIALIIVIIFLAFFTLKTIYNITISIKNNEPETKYGKNRIKTEESLDYLSPEEEKHVRQKKPKTYSRVRNLDFKDEKVLKAEEYAKKIKITSVIGWIIVIVILMIYYMKNGGIK